MDIQQVTLTQLRYAAAIAKHQNFRRAAEACGVSQSGLSMQLQKLEDLLGLVLFDRTKRPVVITAEGNEVLKQILIILKETERLRRVAVESERPSGPYRLGVIPTMSASLIPLFIHTFTAQYPEVELAIDELKTEDMVRELQSDTLDGGLAAIPLSNSGIIEQSLAIEPLVAYLPKDDPLLRDDRLKVSDFASRELWLMPEGHCFRNQSLAFCDAAQRTRPRNVHFESGHFETIISLVNQGIGAALLPRLVADRLSSQEQRAHVRGFYDPIPARHIGFITSRRVLRRRVSDALIASILAGLSATLQTHSEANTTILMP